MLNGLPEYKHAGQRGFGGLSVLLFLVGYQAAGHAPPSFTSAISNQVNPLPGASVLGPYLGPYWVRTGSVLGPPEHGKVGYCRHSIRLLTFMERCGGEHGTRTVRVAGAGRRRPRAAAGSASRRCQ